MQPAASSRLKLRSSARRERINRSTYAVVRLPHRSVDVGRCTILEQVKRSLQALLEISFQTPNL